MVKYSKTRRSREYRQKNEEVKKLTTNEKIIHGKNMCKYRAAYKW